MARSLAFLVVALLLCIILSSQADDGLQCRGERLPNGTFFFNASYDVEEDIRDCETQWLVDDKLAGLAEADGNTKFLPPIITATANTAIIETCHVKLQCLLICPSGSINQKKQCLCDSPTTAPEVGFPYWRIGVWIGGAGVLVGIVIVIVLCWKKKRSRYACGNARSHVPV